MKEGRMANHRVGVVIPAFNEVDNVHRVLDAVCAVDWLSQIVVVDDGSTDGTLTVAQYYVRQDERIVVLRLPRNRGKAGAILAGVRALQTDLVIFLDADLVGLQPYHLHHLCVPLLTDESAMAVAVFCHGGVRTDVSHLLTPDLSGQRCLWRWAAEQALTPLAGAGYGVETGLTIYARRHGWRIRYVAWERMTHIMKEQKRGWIAGLRGRWHMYSQIMEVLIGSKKFLIPKMAFLNEKSKTIRARFL
jgi:glycosyltransferase involved in cell wall biosynthesis